MIEYNPDRIVLMRKLEKTTQADLTSGTGISAAKISKIQNRIVPFQEEDARRIAVFMDYPLSFFTMQDKPTPPTELTYRRSSKTLIREINAVSAEYELMSGTVRRLAERLRIKSHLQWIERIAPHKQGQLTGGEIDALALKAREYLGLSLTGPVPNVTRSLERAGIAVIPMHSAGEKSTYATTSEGVTDPVLSTEIPVIGYLHRENTGDRLRFTKAHEFAHLILHRYRRPPTLQQTENEAHQFAGAFLMPREDAIKAISSATSLNSFLSIKAGWGIAIAALILRAANIGIIDARRLRSLQIQLNSRGWKKHEPVEVEVEYPILFKQMIGTACGSAISPTESKVDSLMTKEELGVPFRYLDLWADGLSEEGNDLGFYEKRFPRAKLTPISSSQLSKV